MTNDIYPDGQSYVPQIRQAIYQQLLGGQAATPSTAQESGKEET